MKIKIYINDPDKTADIMNQVQEIIRQATGREANIRITNQSGLR